MPRLIALVYLFLLAPFASLSGQSRVRLEPLFTLSYPPPPIAGADFGGIVFTESYAFFGTDGGLFRAALPLGSASPERIAFEWTPVTGLAVKGGTLYVALDIAHPTGPGAATHSLMKSDDAGVSWTALDDQLEECIGAFCSRLVSSQIEVVENRLFVNAGGNVLSSADEGKSWSILFGASSTGKPQGQACYDPAFAIAGRRLLLGGECPLDRAYVRIGTLTPDLLSWEEEPVASSTPELENRNVQFLRARGDSGLVYAGIEGALLRSADGGESYQFILHYAGDAPKYPYITHISFPSAHPAAIVLGGFDKGAGGPFLAISTDNGVTWRDESHLLPGVGEEHWFVSALAESPSGQLVIAVEDDAAGLLYVSSLELTNLKRRGARH